RLAQATPLASFDGTALRTREQSIEAEIRGLDARIAGQENGVAPSAGLSRLDEVRAAMAAAGDTAGRTEADQLQAATRGLMGGGAPPVALPAGEFESRRREMLAALDAIEAADASLAPRAQDL